MSTTCPPTVPTSYLTSLDMLEGSQGWNPVGEGGVEPGLGPCTRTPCEQTDTHDWKHYLPVTPLASGYDGRRKRPQKISCSFLKVNLDKITILTNTSWVNKRSQVNIDVIKWYRNLSWNYCERMSISRLWLITFVRLKTTNNCHPNGNCKTSCY